MVDKNEYVFVEGDLAVLVGVDFAKVPVELFLGDDGFVDAEVVCEEGSELFLFESRALVLVVCLEDRLEVFLDDCFEVSHCLLDMI